MSKIIRSFSALVLLAVLISSCAPAQPENNADQIRTLAAQTVSAMGTDLAQTAAVKPSDTPIIIPPTATNTPLPLPPTITPALVSPPTATADLTTGAIELFFKTGGTSVVDMGSLAAGTTRRLKLRLGASQLLMLVLTSSAGDMTIGVQGQDSSVLRAPAPLNVWQSFLPATQYYILTLNAPSATNYGLNIVVPARLSIASGSTTTSYSGPITQPDTVSFLVHGNVGQNMQVTLTSAGSDVLLTIYGLDDGSPLVRYVSGATSWNGTLPGTQDYMIEARATGSSTNFTVTVTIN
ncbi:MAG TPA: hypothetical protein VFF78_08115 [Anaerolineaceae bacterium]|nr:hypothetical protein [Anaerolineaceae bacterium]